MDPISASRPRVCALPAREVVWMATRGGAHTLGLDEDIGSIEAGKKADLIVIDRDQPHLAPGPDPFSTIVYAARGTDVRTTIVEGEILVDDFTPLRIDRRALAAEARDAARQLAARARVG